MIGLNFNSDNEITLKACNVSDPSDYDVVVASLPTKDETQSNKRAVLMTDGNGNIYWDYRLRVEAEEERISDLEQAIATILGMGV